jgi:hypothetical protein
MIELSLNAGLRTKYESLRDWAARAVGAARSAGDPSVTAAAVAKLALAEVVTGAGERAYAVHAEAAARRTVRSPSFSALPPSLMRAARCAIAIKPSARHPASRWHELSNAPTGQGWPVREIRVQDQAARPMSADARAGRLDA